MKKSNTGSAPVERHTPGPWKADGVVILGQMNGTTSLESIDSIKRPVAERQANSRLRVAAPEMLEALKAIHKEWNDSGFDDIDWTPAIKRKQTKILNAAQSAIDNAEGKSE